MIFRKLMGYFPKRPNLAERFLFFPAGINFQIFLDFLNRVIIFNNVKQKYVKIMRDR